MNRTLLRPPTTAPASASGTPTIRKGGHGNRRGQSSVATRLETQSFRGLFATGSASSVIRIPRKLRKHRQKSRGNSFSNFNTYQPLFSLHWRDPERPGPPLPFTQERRISRYLKSRAANIYTQRVTSMRPWIESDSGGISGIKGQFQDHCWYKLPKWLTARLDRSISVLHPVRCLSQPPSRDLLAIEGPRIMSGARHVIQQIYERPQLASSRSNTPW